MTLPEHILSQLAEKDSDRARAVVKATEAVRGGGPGHFKPLELVQIAPGKSLIVVRPSQALRQIPWLKLIDISPARFLMAIPSGTPIEALEVAVRDLWPSPNAQKNESENSVMLELVNLIGQGHAALPAAPGRAGKDDLTFPGSRDFGFGHTSAVASIPEKG